MPQLQRILWIDNAKVLLTFLVIFGHLGVENHFAGNLVSSFHMPAFFLLSGIFASVKGTWAEALKRDFMRLLLPVILWHLIGVFSWTPVQTWVLHKADFWPSLLQQQVDFVLGESWDFGWFMIALFWIKIWYRLINKLPQYGQVIIGLVIFPTIAYALHSYGHMPYFIQSSLMAFPFYFVGHLTKEAILLEDFVLLNKFTPPHMVFNVSWPSLLERLRQHSKSGIWRQCANLLPSGTCWCGLRYKLVQESACRLWQS